MVILPKERRSRAKILQRYMKDCVSISDQVEETSLGKKKRRKEKREIGTKIQTQPTKTGEPRGLLKVFSTTSCSKQG